MIGFSVCFLKHIVCSMYVSALRIHMSCDAHDKLMVWDNYNTTIRGQMEIKVNPHILYLLNEIEKIQL